MTADRRRSRPAMCSPAMHVLTRAETSALRGGPVSREPAGGSTKLPLCYAKCPQIHPMFGTSGILLSDVALQVSGWVARHIV